MELLDYIQNLSCEGETCLIVRQKPVLDGNGQLTHYKDGTIKCTWPAYLPNKWRDNDWSWYINTGAFIIDRFDNGKPAARKENATHCLFFMCDDVGTKSRTPELPPTWIIETSPDNFQYGYAWADQPTIEMQQALLVALANAGYTDPGATNPVRNCRLPGSPNIKPGREGFKARLVEFHPEREYEMPQVLEALQIELGDVGEHKALGRVTLKDNGNDDVLAWLSDQGLLIENTNIAGWAGCVCPNHAKHSDGNEMARYRPVDRTFMCFHGSCEEWRSEKFLAWVAEQGGPTHQAGLRDDVLAEKMKEIFDKIDKGAKSQFTAAAEAQAAIAAAEERNSNQAEKTEIHGLYAYVESDDAYFHLKTRRMKQRRVFNALFAHIECHSIHLNASGKASRVNASQWFDENREKKHGVVLSGLTYAAGETEIVRKYTENFGNTWINHRPPGKAGDCSRWLDLFARVVPNKEEREHMLNVFAYKRQHPAVKINHAILLMGQPGIGKDTLYAPFLYSIGGIPMFNISQVSNEELTGAFNYWQMGEVIVINELAQPESKDRRALENQLKPVIAAPPEILNINMKFQAPLQIANRALVLASSNKDAPISLPSDDRRWFIAKSAAEPMPLDEGKSMWTWYKNGGFDAITAFLDARDVSAFDPGGRPPMTEAKMLMIEHGYSGAEAHILEQIQSRQGPFKHGAVCGPWHKVIAEMQVYSGNHKLYPQALLLALREAGWRDMGHTHSRDYPTKKHLFCAPGLVDVPKAELRRIAETGKADTPLKAAYKAAGDASDAAA